MISTASPKRSIQVLKPHISLNVSNLQKSIEFYSRMFQTQPVKRRERYAKFDLQIPSLNLALNENDLASSGQGNLSHLGIQLAKSEDVSTMKEMWQEQGLIAVDELQTTCCYALQDKVWVTDPDGNSWEAFAILEDNVLEQQGTGKCSSQGCC